MGVGFTPIGITLDQQRCHAIAEGEPGSITGSVNETICPALKPQPVLYYQIGATGLL